MTSDIIKLLGKKGKLTGVEVGNLIIKDTIHQLLNPTEKELITEAEAQTAINSLVDTDEIKAFNKRNAIGVFLTELRQKILYADLLLSKKYMDTYSFINEARQALQILQTKTPKRLTYAEYEAYKKEKLEAYFNERKYRPSLFDLILYEIRDFYDKGIETGIELVEDYIDQPLTKEEKAFYGDSLEVTENKCNWEAKGKETKELLKEEKYKEAIECYLSDKHSYTETKTLDKSDLAYDLLDFWNESDQSEKTFKRILKDYKDLLLYSLKAVNEKYFNGKLKDITLEETLDKRYTIKELYEKYGYNYLPKALNDEPILLTTYGVEETAGDRALMHTEAFLKVFNDADFFKDCLETYEETIVILENLNILLDLTIEETGLSEIGKLKYDTSVAKKNLQNLYWFLCDLAFTTTFDEEKAKVIKKAVENIKNINVKTQKATPEKINKARELLHSSKKFKEYQRDLFILIAGAYKE